MSTMPSFRERFIDGGNFGSLAPMDPLDEVGFCGVMVADHVPRMDTVSSERQTNRLRQA
jgi:hypothetical protein